MYCNVYVPQLQREGGGAAWIPLALEKAETYLWLFSGIRDVSLEPKHVFFARPSLASFESWETPVARMPEVFGDLAWGSRTRTTTRTRSRRRPRCWRGTR
jgi:hypothetical protein